MTIAKFGARAFSMLGLVLALYLGACSSTVCTPTKYWVPDPVADGDSDNPQDRDSDTIDTSDGDSGETEGDIEGDGETAPTDGDLDQEAEPEGEGESEEEVVPLPLALADMDLLEPVLGGVLAYDWTNDVPPFARVRYFKTASSGSVSFIRSGDEALLAAPRDASHLTLSDTAGWALYVPYRKVASSSAPQLILRQQNDQTFTFYGLTLPEALVGTAYRAVFLPQNPDVATKTFQFVVIALWHNESATDYMTARVFKAVFDGSAFKVTANGQTQLIGLGKRVDEATRVKLLETKDRFYIAMHEQFYRFNEQGLYAPELGNFRPSFPGVAEGTPQTLIDAAYTDDASYLSVLMRINSQLYWGIWRTNDLSKTWLSRVIANGTDTMRTNFAPQNVFAVASEADSGAAAKLFVLDLSGLNPKPWENTLYTYGRPTFMDAPERLLKIAPLSTNDGQSFSYAIDEVKFETLHATSTTR